MTLRQLACCLTAMVAVSQPARALTFNFTTVAGDTLTAEQAAAFQTAANVWSANLSDAITVSLQIGFRNLGTNILGSTIPSLVTVTEGATRYLLNLDAKDATDTAAVASLRTSTQANLELTSAEARAIGFSTPGITSDGTIEFSSTFAFSNTRNADGSIAAGTYDLIGIAEHEIGHLLGFISSIDLGTGSAQTLLDQFRYSATSVRSVTAGANAYFSIDNGATNLAGFSVGGTGNDQASHWLTGTNGVMVPEAAAGQTQNISALDIQALDTIGYDVVTVPEPWSLGLLAIGAIAAAQTRRRRA